MLRKNTISYGWWVVIACAGIQLYFSGTFLNGFTAYFNPIADEFPWTYTLISLATTLRNFEIGVTSPLVGVLVDRYRPQKMLIAGVIIGAIGYFVFGRIHSLGSFYFAFLLIGLSASMTSQVVVTTAIAAWFKRRTALVIGIFAGLTGASGFLVPLTVSLIANLGWRQTITIFAIVAIALCIPLCLLIRDPRKKPEVITSTNLATKPKSIEKGFTIKEILKQKNFWTISLSMLFLGMAPSAIAVHQIPYLVSIKMSRETAGWMALVISLSGVGGGLGFGWLADIIDKRIVLIFTALAQVAGLVLFAYSTSTSQVVASLIVLGIGIGGVVPLRPILLLQFFGLKSFATVQGLSLVLFEVGMMTGPTLVGWMYDSFKTYQPAWLTIAAMILIAVPLILSTSKKSKVQFITEN